MIENPKDARGYNRTPASSATGCTEAKIVHDRSQNHCGTLLLWRPLLVSCELAQVSYLASSLTGETGVGWNNNTWTRRLLTNKKAKVDGIVIAYIDQINKAARKQWIELPRRQGPCSPEKGSQKNIFRVRIEAQEA